MYRDTLSFVATGRQDDMFSDDVDQCRTQITESITGKRVLIIGGAGSIGSSTVFQVAKFSPRSLHVVDQNENSLAELVRDLRSQQKPLNIADFRALPLDFGSLIMHRFIKEQPPYDIVMNFAALKHVRSEKDIYSLLQMLDTNVVKPARLLSWLRDKGETCRYFCVSTDKAANPVNLMGGSKRLMEHVIFSDKQFRQTDASVISARFANVAFSDGSLLYSWLQRFQKRQPIVAPMGTKRFFISLAEAGQICLVASTCCPVQTIVVPRLQADIDLRDLSSIAIDFLQLQGFEPHEYHSEEEARESLLYDVKKGRYPLLLTPLDTDGEKPYEEFVGQGETAEDIGLPNLLAISYRGGNIAAIEIFLSSLRHYLNNPKSVVGKYDMIRQILEVIPELQHAETGRNLDERM